MWMTKLHIFILTFLSNTEKNVRLCTSFGDNYVMTSEFIIDVTEADFEYHVITYSQNAPVIVDFWADWCGPCKTLGPILERLAEEAKGKFRLAKVNVDQNSNLAKRYNVRSIPVVKAFRDGLIVAEFTGVQPEGKIREFIREVAPDQGDLNLEKGFSLLEMQEPEEAETCFRTSLETSSDNTRARLGLIKSLLLQGKGNEAEDLLYDFPASSEYASAARLQPLARGLVRFDQNEAFNEAQNPLDAAFNNSVRLVKMGNFEAAMDGLLEILRADKHFREDEARLILVAILEILGDKNPITRQYRGELASVLF
jgi:putative thioredoxin